MRTVKKKKKKKSFPKILSGNENVTDRQPQNSTTPILHTFLWKILKIILMSIHNKCFYGEIWKILSLNYHQIPTLAVLLNMSLSFTVC